MRQDLMENLPLEITSNILSRLPILLRLPCRQVCRTWGSLVPRLPRTGLLYGVLNDKAAGHETQAEFYFSEQNNGTNHVDDDDQQLSFLGKLIKYDHSLIMRSPPPSVSAGTFMVGSCKGLVCYAGYADADSVSCDRTFYICNPVTGEQVQLPAVPWGGGSGCSYSEQAIGFGYGRSQNNCKVVRIMAHNNYHGYVFVQVYTLQGGTGWRSKRIAFQNPLSSQLSGLPSVGVFAGGALHWIEQDTTKTTVVAFDLEHGTFKRLQSIPCVDSGTKHVRLLMELGGNLCFLEVAPGKHVRIWEASESRRRRRRRSVSPWVRGRLIFPWVAKLSIAWEDRSWFEPFALAESDECLFWYNAVLSCYDTEAKTLTKLDDTLKKLMDGCTPLVCTTTRATPHMNSLVSLKGVMEEVHGEKRLIIATY